MPRYYIGNSGVLFMVRCGGSLSALKCYTTPAPHRSTIYGSKFRAAEIYIPLDDDSGEWIDVTLEAWIEGITLGTAIKRARGDREQLAQLSASFDQMALELLQATWAHGDLSCDNIIVSDEQSLHLIDFESSFQPQFEGLDSSSLGTEAYQHPARDQRYFDRSIDDYSIALLSTALAALRLDAELYDRFGGYEGLLYNPKQLLAGRDKAFRESCELFAAQGCGIEYAIAKLLRSATPDLYSLLPLLRLKVEGLHSLSCPAEPYYSGGACGFVGKAGRAVTPPIFSEAHRFCEGVAAVKIGSVWHYIDSALRPLTRVGGYPLLKNVREGVGRGATEQGWVEIDIASLVAKN